MSLTITERAAQEVNTIAKNQDLDPDKAMLRMAVKAGGCAGFTYDLDLVEEEGKEDQEFVSNNVKIICDPKSFLYLDGTNLICLAIPVTIISVISILAMN